MHTLRIQMLTAAVVTLVALFAVAHPDHAHDDADTPGGGTRTSVGESRVTIEVRGEHRIITANGLPDHEPGAFPNRGNPNAISPQRYTYRVPLHPRVNETPTPNEFGPFGVALNGVPFDPGTAEFWRGDRDSGWREEAIRPGDRGQLGMDEHHAHVQPNGAYHYHGIPTGLVANRGGGERMVLIGYAADGFPIYNNVGHRDANDANSPFVELRPSYRLKRGTRPGGPGGDRGPSERYDGTYTQDYEYVEGLGDLDACNGRTGVTPEYPQGTYYYVVTRDFPHVPRAWRGTPDPGFERPSLGTSRGAGPGDDRSGRPDRGGRRGGGPPPDRPPPPR